MADPPPSNLDMLGWFGEEDLSVCDACGERACVTAVPSRALFCLGCGAIWIEGVRIDKERRILP
jgi:hypothetical protein